MKVSNKKTIAIAVSSAVVLSLAAGAFLQFRPSADEEISRMQAIVSDYTQDDGYMDPDSHEIDESEADALDQAAWDGMSSSVIDGSDGAGEDPSATVVPEETSQPTQEPGPIEEPGDIDPVETPEPTQPPVQPTQEPVTPPEETHVQVNIRDWKQYRSSYPYNHMTSAEQSLWLRLEAAAEDYMNNSSLDAVYSDTQNLFTTYSVRYGDLELSRDTAIDLTQYFMDVNKQYWFLRPSILSTSKVLYVGIFDIGADGDDRAEVTNRLFTELDNWSASMDGASTGYQRVKAAHDKVVDEIGYEAGVYDQSVYSALLQGRSVCSGYSGVMSMLLNRVGIDTAVVSNSSHAWNAVQMEDGAWYGLDATWDDSLNTYQFFLVSDENMQLADNTKETHKAEGNVARWSPALTSYNYSVSAYDSTGQHVSEAPEMPEGLHIDYIDASHGRASWESVPGAGSYEFRLYKGSSLCGSLDLSGTSLKLSSLNSTPMTVKVRAVRDGQAGLEYSDWASIEYVHGADAANTDSGSGDVSGMAEPGNLHVLESGETYVRVGWDAVDGADKYEIQAYKDANYTTQTLSGSVQASSVKLSGFQPGQTSYIQVRAVGTVNGAASQSGWVKLAITAKAPEAVVTMDAPEGLMFQKKTETSVRATWNAVEGASEYDIEVYKDAALQQRTVSSRVYGTAISFSNIRAGQTYYVRVRARGMVNGSVLESEWSQASFGDEVMHLSAPENIKAAKIDSSTARITWDSVTDASKYQVQVSYTSDFSKISAETSVTGTSLRLSQIKSGKTYYVRVKAVGSVNGTSLESEWVNTSYKK